MPGYVTKSLQRFLRSPPPRPQHEPCIWTTPKYGAKIKYALPPSSLPMLDKQGTCWIQAINGTFIYYSRVFGPCMLTATNKISSQ